MPMHLSGLYYITDSTLTRKDIFSDTQAALKAGVKIVQYREKNASSGALFETAKKLKALCHQHDALFIMNDRLDIALAMDADGVHLGQDDLPYSAARKLAGDDFIIGISTHSPRQALEAETMGADYIGFGPVYSTSTKQGAGDARGLDELKTVISTVKIPVTAIGGIKTDRLVDITATGCKSAAIISEVVGAKDVATKVREINGYFSV